MTSNPDIRVEFTAHFIKRLKQLRKKYPHVRNDLQAIVLQLENGETPGDRIQGIGYAVYKVRARNSDARRGKSGGYRVIYYLRTAQHILLIEIYSKSEKSDIDAHSLRRMIDDSTDT